MRHPVIIVGAGGHARVVADALFASGTQVLGFTDPDPALHGRIIDGFPVLGDDCALADHAQDRIRLVNGIGGVGRGVGPSLRRRVQQRLADSGWSFTGVRHPTAIVAPSARVASSAQLLAAAVVQPGADIGDGCIVNTAAVVEHDSVVGAYTHVAPRALICGDVAVGPDCHVGAGAVLREGIRLGAATVVGAGGVVVADFAGSGVLVGVPARRMEDKR
jgi:sugar O-acyltransferase (sialic acid O-acetyltransferase NeuD family)